MKYMMNVIGANMVNVSLIAAGGYLPAGNYRVYAHTALYGFAVIFNTPPTLTINFSSSITASPVVSSFVGGNTLTLNSIGFIIDKI